jgi:hypothetical protein
MRMFHTRINLREMATRQKSNELPLKPLLLTTTPWHFEPSELKNTVRVVFRDSVLNSSSAHCRLSFAESKHMMC